MKVAVAGKSNDSRCFLLLLLLLARQALPFSSSSSAGWEEGDELRQDGGGVWQCWCSWRVTAAVLLCFLFSRSQLNFSSFLSKKPPLLFQRCLAPFFLCFFPVPLSFVQKKLSPSFSFPALSLVLKNSTSRPSPSKKTSSRVQLLRAVFIGEGGAGTLLRMGSRGAACWLVGQ